MIHITLNKANRIWGKILLDTVLSGIPIENFCQSELSSYTKSKTFSKKKKHQVRLHLSFYTKTSIEHLTYFLVCCWLSCKNLYISSKKRIYTGCKAVYLSGWQNAFLSLNGLLQIVSMSTKDAGCHLFLPAAEETGCYWRHG